MQNFVLSEGGGGAQNGPERDPVKLAESDKADIFPLIVEKQQTNKNHAWGDEKNGRRTPLLYAHHTSFVWKSLDLATNYKLFQTMFIIE